MKAELIELSAMDGKEVYEMILEIGLGENGFTNPFPMNSFEEFVQSLPRFVEKAGGINLPDQYVPQTIYWLYVDGRPVAFGKLRHYLNEKLLEYGGHIGYIVRPCERGKGFGTLFLQKLLEAAKAKQISEVLLTCDEDNVRSRRVIESNNGQLNEITNGICKYWIKN
ncbi:GNAT family N-acetyltransferase [Paenibacillus sp. J2TS4]|uniref:GNAT family N-acetyltransferase n=1 Tax=Paenibacillus sp. J2TS4 TaxID=2807194 RepID=UPI001B08B2A9|nr:GNAT family N-acetyltransferase [Paenibacillus sp. J2TS4]GIP31682.1 acetyltransferase [Paenibacillus sp. J2TS4]